jgi:hypothetical protein
MSNEKYVENNRKLDSELVKVRGELENVRKLQQESVKDYETSIAEFKAEHEEILAEAKNLLDMKNKKMQKSKTRKLSKKRS